MEDGDQVDAFLMQVRPADTSRQAAMLTLCLRLEEGCYSFSRCYSRPQAFLFRPSFLSTAHQIVPYPTALYFSPFLLSLSYPYALPYLKSVPNILPEAFFRFFRFSS